MIKRLLLLTLLFTSLMTKAQIWQICNSGSCNYIIKSFIESSGTLIASGGCASIDSGSTWSLSGAGFDAFCLENNSAGIFAGTDTAIYFTNNSGSLWTKVFNTAGTLNFVWGLAVLNDTIFAATRGSGILMSPNNGITWSQVNSGLPNDSVYSILVKGNLLFAGMYGNGVYMSSNSGVSWTVVNSGLPSLAYTRSLATDGINIYAAINGSIYISNNNGTFWTQASNATFINKIINVGNAMLAGGFTMSGTEGVYRSLDHGATWVLFNNGFPVSCPYGVGGFYSTSSYVYCGIESQCGSIYRISRNDVITSVSNYEISNYLMDVFPNPFLNELCIKISSTLVSEFILYDITSRKLLHENFIQSITLNTKQLAKGVYFYEVRSGNRLCKKGKVIKN